MSIIGSTIAGKNQRRRMFDHEFLDKAPTGPEHNFKITMFYPLIDGIVNSLKICV